MAETQNEVCRRTSAGVHGLPFDLLLIGTSILTGTGRWPRRGVVAVVLT